jgi:hypothetical protein
MNSDQYIWLIWSGGFLISWIILRAAFPAQRRVMWWSSVFTAPFGLTEPLFVPEYWNPLCLFDLAQKTGGSSGSAGGSSGSDLTKGLK